MTTYITAEFNPKDKEALQTYGAKAASTIAKYSGEFLVKGTTNALVGATNYGYKAIIVFPTKELAESWFNSQEYQNLTTVRDQGMEAIFLLISQ